jgi:hypothetical protein
MIALTAKKTQALAYLVKLLDENKVKDDMAYKQWYFRRKQKVDQAIMKVDIEFLEAYHHVLDMEGVKAIGELPKEKFSIIKDLQLAISEAKILEEKIKSGEEVMLTTSEPREGVSASKALKHVAPRAVEAYKKLKK